MAAVLDDEDEEGGDEVTRAERRLLFAEKYVENGGKISAAAQAAGYRGRANSPVLNNRGNRLLKRPEVRAHVEYLLQESMIQQGVKAAFIVNKLAEAGSQADAVKLRAATALIELSSTFAKIKEVVARAAAAQPPPKPKSPQDLAQECLAVMLGLWVAPPPAFFRTDIKWDKDKDGNWSLDQNIGITVSERDPQHPGRRYRVTIDDPAALARHIVARLDEAARQ
jgi:hypothetical protein